MPYKSNAELPESVRGVLPEEAQSIFRGAFNAFETNNPDAAEERSFKVAWAAVERKFKKGEGEKWTLKSTSDGLVQNITLDEMIVADDAGVRRTTDGYLVARPRVARTGVQLYQGREVGKPTMDVVRVYRPPEEVFSTDTMRSFCHRPVTVDHPPEPVTAKNWKRFASGQTGDEIARDGQYVRVPMVMMDEDAIKQFEDGKRQLSMGYTCDLLWEAGKSPEGEVYDAVQIGIRGNHLAVVQAARGGDKLTIGDLGPDNARGKVMTEKTILVDGISVTIADASLPIIQRAFADRDKRIADMEHGMAAAEEERKKKEAAADAALRDATEEKKKVMAENETIKKKLEEDTAPARLDAMVADRVSVINKAKAVLGDRVVIDGRTNADIRRQVVDAKMGDTAKGWSDSEIGASFSALTISVGDDQQRQQQQYGGGGNGFSDAAHAFGGGRVASNDAVKAYDAYVKDLGDAWKQPIAKQ